MKRSVRRGWSRSSGPRRSAGSHVDESLFGSLSDPSETLQIITRDLIRTLRVRRRDPSGESISLSTKKLEQISCRREEEMKEREERRRRREEEQAAAEESRQRLQESVKEEPVWTEAELEDQRKSRLILERNNFLRLEQEQEVKELNQLILGAQCQATRDAQIQEKQQIQAEMMMEEKRLDAMMEVERRKNLETTDQIQELRRQQRVSGMQQICGQIQQRREQQQMTDMNKEQERAQVREKQEKMNLEDEQALQNRREQQRLLLEEVMNINAQAVRAREQRQEEEKMIDSREMEFLRRKQEREKELEEEQRRLKKEKEQEISRLRAQQQRQRDFKAEQDELRARRNQERADREWRRKEREEATKKAQDEEKLRDARLQQVQRKEKLLSMEAAREKAEFQRLLKVQQEALTSRRQEEAQQRERMQRHSLALRQQVREVEKEALERRKEIFREGERLKQEARQKRERLLLVRDKKLQELRATGLPEKYCSEVQRKIEINNNNKEET